MNIKQLIKKAEAAQARQNRYVNWKRSKLKAVSDVCFESGGRMFRDWIEGRSNGFNDGDQINHPVYVIEDLIRSYILCEREIKAGSVDLTTPDYIIIGTSGLIPDADYYNNAYVINYTQGWTKKITDYTDNSLIIYNDSLTDISEVNDIFDIENIQGNNVIDIASFDAIGNATDGSLKDYVCAGSIRDEIDVIEVISQITSEFMLYIYDSLSKIKIADLNKTNIVGTLQYPVFSKGKRYFSFTSSEDIYTSFEFKYKYSVPANKFTKTIYLDKNTSSESYLDSYMATCKTAELNYKTQNKFVFEFNWITNDSIALLMAEKFIKNYTRQLILVDYTGTISHSFKYEIGDQLLIYFPPGLPSNYNYSKVFMIFSKKININSSTVEFGLIEMADQPTEANLITEDNNNLITEDSNQLITEQVWLA